jgi:hypothetical protein
LDTLGGGEGEYPAEAGQVTTGGFDVAEVDLKDVGNPGAFHPAAAVHGLGLAGMMVEAADAGA